MKTITNSERILSLSYRVHVVFACIARFSRALLYSPSSL